MPYEVVHQDIIEWSKSYTGPKFHAILSDPPYGLKFMNKDWDVVSAREWGEALLPHLHPGAIVLMFGGTRTWHKLATGMEEAGFQIWDTLMWLYGTGFPKGQDISKLIDKKNGDVREIIGTTNRDIGPSQKTGYLGSSTFRESMNNPGNLLTAPASEQSTAWSGHKSCALKPAWEPILALRVPSDGKSYAELVLEFGSGCLNIDGTRIEYQSEADKASATPQGECTSKNNGSIGAEPDAGRGESRITFERPEQLGRYPANLVLDEESAVILDEQSGVLKSGKLGPGHTDRGKDAGTLGAYSGRQINREFGNDSGGASRFFYVAKAAGKEKNAGVEKNTHPTVKPLALTKWLATLLLPPDSVKPRRLLVPFAGSGSEMIGALQAGWDEVTGVEREAEYCETAKARLNHWTHKGD